MAELELAAVVSVLKDQHVDDPSSCCVDRQFSRRNVDSRYVLVRRDVFIPQQLLTDVNAQCFGSLEFSVPCYD